MKKILLSIFLLTFSFNYSYSYELSNSDKLIINKISSKIEKLLLNNSLEFREKLEDKINEIQNQYKENKKIYSIFEEIKINTHLVSYKDEYENHYKKFNIDFDKVKQSWLNWSNIERNKIWVSNYSYDKRLDNTAYEWSKIQAKEKNRMSHIREWEKWPYDYKVIEKWFNVRWIKCSLVNRATTSESIAKHGYYCRDWECSDELIKSLREVFDLYMWEKWLEYPDNAHYKWIISSDFSQMWIWLSLYERFDDTYKDYRSFDYYLTIHYCTNFKK